MPDSEHHPRPHVPSPRSDARRAPAPPPHLLAAAPVGVGTVDADLRWRWLNDALAGAFGASVDELVGTSIGASLDAIRPTGTMALRHALETGESVVGFEMERHGIAGPRTWRLSFYPRPRDGGGPDGLDVVGLEVSERRRVEERFLAVSRAARALTGPLGRGKVSRAIVDEVVPALGADTGFVGFVDEAGRVSIGEMLGEPRQGDPEGAVAMPLPAAALAEGRPVVAARDVAPGGPRPADAGDVEGAFGPALLARTGLAPADVAAAVAVPLRIEAGAGVIGLLYARAREFSETDVALFEAIGELSEQAFERARLHEADRASREANQLLRFVVESADDAIISTDLEGRVTSWNRAAEAIFGYTSDEMVGQSIDRVVGPERAAESEQIGAAIRRGESFRLGLTQRRARDGRLVDLSITVSPVRADDGRVIGDARIERDLTDLVRAQKAERAAAERLRALIESNPNGVLLADEAGVIEYVNRTTAELFGYAPEELQGRSVELLVPDASRTAHEEQRREYLHEPSMRPMGHGRNLLGRRRDGSLLPVEVGLSSFVVDGARFVSAVIADISERRAAEAGRVASEARLTHALTAARMVAWEWDVETGAVEWSENAAQVVGPLPSTADAFLQWSDPHDGVDHRKVVEEAIRGRGRYSVQFALTKPGGERLWLEGDGRVSVDAAGRTVITGVLIDITGRRSAERELRRVTDTLAALVAASPIAIALLDLDGTVQLWNRTAERMFGWREEEVVGGANRAIPPDRRRDAAAFVARVASGETLVNHEDRWVSREGKSLQVAVSAAPVRTSDGLTLGIVALIEDVTARRALEEQLLQGQKMEGIGRLAGGVAHDFNNMLTAIQGFADLLAADLGAGSGARESLDGIREAASRAAALTRQLLAFSRRQHLEPKVLEVNDVVLGMEPMLRRLIGEDVELVVGVRPGAGRILADPSQLEQVILNLVVNARDAMPNGGRLSIETDTVVFDEVYALEHYEVPPGTYVMLAVSDTGIGMDRETRLHVFEPFFTTKEQGKGTGLGLSTIYGIVRQSGGHIWLYSEPSQGTTFKVYFPLVSDRAASDEHAAPRVAPEHGTETVLLVEDETAVRNLMTIVLRRQGYQLLVAKSGEEALSTADAFSGRIDLLVTDVVMSGMSGPDVARELRRRRPEIATLLLSGYTEEVFTNARGLDHGDGFLSKPFTPDALARKIREVLRSRGERSQARDRAGVAGRRRGTHRPE